MVQQAMTLAALAVQKEELSKSMDDEASDDAFELYLAALSTMLHALPCKYSLDQWAFTPSNAIPQ
jgi:hypothetical protein